MPTAQMIVQDLLDLADVRINGNRAWDMQAYNHYLFNRILREGSLGLGEAYMDGWWDAEDLEEFFTRILLADLENKVRGDWKTVLWIIGQTILNRQKKNTAFHIGEHHYDTGNDLFEAMLDQRKVYSCGYWCDARNLDEAQEAKLDLVCRKLQLKPGQKILDIGCGWGSFAKFAAEKYHVSVVGITVSKEQVALGNELCAGLPVQLQLQDYRDVEGEFDHIVSIGMFEHVGFRNYRIYMQVAHDHLKDDGLFLLHTIGQKSSNKVMDPWFGKYIFPNSLIPSALQICEATESLFSIEDWHNFGTDYTKTLLEWFYNFDNNWGTLQPKYGDRFYRMWKYYLLASAAAFRARKNHVWQIVLSKNGFFGGYESVR